MRTQSLYDPYAGMERWEQKRPGGWRRAAPLYSSSTCTGNPEAVNLKVHHSVLFFFFLICSSTALITVKEWLGGSLSSCFYGHFFLVLNKNYNFHLPLHPAKKKKKFPPLTANLKGTNTHKATQNGNTGILYCKISVSIPDSVVFGVIILRGFTMTFFGWQLIW